MNLHLLTILLAFATVSFSCGKTTSPPASKPSPTSQPAIQSTISPATTRPSMESLRKAAEDGDAKAQCDLGLRYETGKDVGVDQAESVKWYRKAAEQGNAEAQCNLGVHYSVGMGIEKDMAEAVRWLRKSADQGFAEGQLYLGTCYDLGDGVKKDRVEAAKWYQKAVDQGNEIAKIHLDLLRPNIEEAK